MNSESVEDRRTLAWLMVAAAGVRAAFGIIMAIDAYLKLQPAFAAHYVGYLQNAMKGQPLWLAPWFNFWLRIVIQDTGFFVLATRLIETVIAIGLLLGLARRITYIGGALFSLLIWSTAEGFGGPYTSGATNLGPALIYALIFVTLALFERILGNTPYSLDYYIGRRFPRWGSLVEWAPRHVWQRPPPALNLDHQLAAIGAIMVALVFALASLGSATATKALPPTPENAAAAVSPLSIASTAPVAHPAPAALPPVDWHRRQRIRDARCDRYHGGDCQRRAISGVDIQCHCARPNSACSTRANGQRHFRQQREHDALDRFSRCPDRPGCGLSLCESAREG